MKVLFSIAVLMTLVACAISRKDERVERGGLSPMAFNAEMKRDIASDDEEYKNSKSQETVKPTQ